MTKVLILGGGLSGLSAAHFLSQRNFNIILLEQDKDLGGLASSYSIDNQHIPKTYHHIMYGDKITLDLLQDLGLKSSLYWKKLKVGFYSNKNFYDFSSSLSILKFKPISLWGRMKFGLLVLKARQKANWSHLNGRNIEDYCLSTSGEDAYKLINYIVQAKFAESPRNISAAWLMSRFGHESKSVSDKFGYLNGGIKLIIDSLVNRCKSRKSIIKTKAKATHITIKNKQVKNVLYEEDGKLREDKPDVVISTLPIPLLLDICEGLPRKYNEALKNIRYKSSLCLTLALQHRVSPFYWLNIMDLKKHPFVGVFEHKHLNTELNYPSLIYAVKYLDIKNNFWLKTDEEIVEEFLRHLSEIFEFNLKEKMLWWRLHRAEFSTPVFTPHYGQFMPKAKSPVKNLYIGGISRTYPKDRYIGTAIQTGIEAAEAVLSNY
jgi:protoporphyrinogen oxidase